MTYKDISDRVKLHALKTLSDNHYTLRRAEFDFRHSDGTWRHGLRESYDIGDGAAVLPLDRAAGKLMLIRQFRWPVFERGERHLLIEAVAGKLDGDTPEACVIREAREEAGILVTRLRLVTHCFMSPGAVTEKLSLFLADYDSAAPRQTGGGLADEGEDIEVLEITLDEGLAMAASGDIIDAKTIILLQAAKLETYSPPG
jgi:nudix-type nucleoside diphosphatase (YffH/AdpP family)